MASVINLDEFKALPKDQRIQYLSGLRMIYSDKEIRDAWDLKFDAFDYHLKALGLKDTLYGKKVDPKELQETVADRLRNKAGKGTNTSTSTNTSRAKAKNKDNIIELEYKVVADKEEKLPINPAYLEPQLALEAPKAVSHMISYPSVTGNVAQLRKRLEAILTLVELEGDDVELVLGITIDRK